MLKGNVILTLPFFVFFGQKTVLFSSDQTIDFCTYFVLNGFRKMDLKLNIFSLL